jgi:hypothetical protein
VTQQDGYLQGRRDEGDPLRGYNFRIVTRQGAGAPGGRYDYIINDNMIGRLCCDRNSRRLWQHRHHDFHGQ